MNSKKFLLKPGDLRKTCSPTAFKFTSTEEVKPLKGIIGQERAISAISLGLDIESEGYNIYLAGPTGIGKTTLARKMLMEKAAEKSAPADWCYVYNFERPDKPKVLQMPPGKGKLLKQDMAACINEAISTLTNSLTSEEYLTQKSTLLNEFSTKASRIYLELEQEARSHGFTITQSQQGFVPVPINNNGEAMGQDEYLGLSEAERSEMMLKSTIVQEKLQESIRKYRNMEASIREKVKALEQQTANQVVGPIFQALRNNYAEYAAVTEYLNKVENDFLEHYELFIQQEENNTLIFFRNIDKRSFQRRYQINLLVDNSNSKHAPVIFENDHSFANLFGQIEYEGEFGVLATDFTKIKAGTIHRANGGYLVLQVHELLKNSFVWDNLKRILKNNEISVENISRIIGFTNTETLHPEPIPLKLKIILIGEPIYYYLLHQHDQDFTKLFKIRADFESEMPRSRKHINDYSRLIHSVCERKNLRHFSPEAVAALIDFGSRLTEDQQKLSISFNKLMDLINESNCLAGYDGSDIVQEAHVKQALKQKIYRNSMIEDKLHEAIKRNTIIINIDGMRIGEINGLAVYEIGEYRFARPVRITAKTFMGEKGLVNIEREIDMSGSIHSKGILTLGAYLGQQYAQDKPLTLSASITFEQSYQGIEGDSASSAELYAIISSLAKVPLNQKIAVTGSVNQNGEIQPVGGVNEKIEGFFKVCREKGLDGKQGVIIPRKNVANLMLDEEIVDAVKRKLFNVWAIEHINEGLMILTGMEAGIKNEQGKFPEGTINYLANQQLEEWSIKQRPHLEQRLPAKQKTGRPIAKRRQRRRR